MSGTMKTANVPSRTSSWRECAMQMTSMYAFKEGVNSVWFNKPFNPDYYWYDDQIFYERGRAFAIYCKIRKLPKPKWYKNRISKISLDRAIRSLMARFVI